ncbi:hypothetical protein GALMADRAFT_875141 [Galerina marginata CBS 339.88]|uniref:F-box domain-containing protein n=1 Tax=Galerina marginata (strain CBS 339.88) TaxID=685588 RepID=A0A067TJ76_GALM3|nr:hypothetical protein GALMADRAFT_875141 [Galerina marginata CBS 339.88]
MVQGPISAIPPEILSAIFEYVLSEFLVAHDLRAVTRPQNHSPRDPDEDSIDDSESSTTSSSARAMNSVDVQKLLDIARSTSFFPNAVASVCTFWEDVLSSTPDFWTTLVFFLDKDPTGTEEVKRYLSYSPDLPIDVFMTRREDLCPPPWGAEMSETPWVRENMECLMPHIHRCRTLHVDVTINISLPILPSHIPSSSTRLQTVSFMSDVGLAVWEKDEEKHNFFAEPIVDRSERGSTFAFEPRLNTLSIDGRNFQQAIAENKSWLSELDDLEELTIFHYAPLALSRETCASETDFDTHECDECRLDLYETLEKIEWFSSLINLKFDAVHFNISPAEHEETAFNLSFIGHLTFENMAPEIIQEIFRVCMLEGMEDLTSLTFVHCPRLHEVKVPDFGIPSLYLLGLEEDVDLEPIVTAWDGTELSITGCASFSDAFLQLLGTPEVPESDGDDNESDEESELGPTFLCNEMTSLDIHTVGPPTFPVGALRKMVEARGCMVDYSDDNWKQSLGFGPAIVRLNVSGQVPELSTEELAWFRSRILWFSWIEG